MELSEELDQCDLAFVYGTLKKGYGNARIFEMNGAEYLGPAVTEEDYLLLHSGCPMVYHKVDLEEQGVELVDDLLRKVRGDLWVIPNEVCLKQLDRLEGHPNFYTRRTIEVKYNDEIKLAWCYEVKRLWYWEQQLGNVNSEGEYQWP